MQGPKLKIVAECGNCEFLNYNKDYFICEKLSVGCTWTLDKLAKNAILDKNPIPPSECPFLEENSIHFHNESLFQLHENREEKLKKKIESIFSDFKFEKLTLNKILLSLEEVTDFQISQIQKELSQYNFKIERASDDINLILTLTKRE